MTLFLTRWKGKDYVIKATSLEEALSLFRNKFYDAPYSMQYLCNEDDVISVENKGETISLDWSIGDVRSVAEDMDVELSILDAADILQDIYRNHDASIGVNWEVIRTHIEMYLDSE